MGKDIMNATSQKNTATKKPTPQKSVAKTKTTTPKKPSATTKTNSPTPVSKPIVEPVEKPKAEIETPSGATGTVKFNSATGLDKAFLQSSDGTKYTSTVPVGSYTIKLVCNGKTTTAGTKKIQEGKTLTLTCDCMFKKCK